MIPLLFSSLWFVSFDDLKLPGLVRILFICFRVLEDEGEFSRSAECSVVHLGPVYYFTVNI